MKFFYVYLLQSQVDATCYYVGFTEDLTQRLAEHNEGKLPRTARYRPWIISSAHAFAQKRKALAFEK